jgi:hypothetical protein
MASLHRLARVRRHARVRRRVLEGRVVRYGWKATRIGIAMTVVSLLLAVGAFATTTLYGQYGPPRNTDSTLAWADRAAIYKASDCRDCHGKQATAVAADSHAELICETCHVPTVDHPGPFPGVIQALETESSAVCTTCHSETAGRPARFPQVEAAAHYQGATCLQCHDPHSATAVTPPEVTHPLQNLPDCTACHAPDGLKRFPAGHQLAPDVLCLGCHRTTGRVP